MRVRINDIQIFDLDAQTVLQISRFVRLARQREGHSMRLSDSAVLAKVFACGSHTDDAELKALFGSIRRSIKQTIPGINIEALDPHLISNFKANQQSIR